MKPIPVKISTSMYARGAGEEKKYVKKIISATKQSEIPDNIPSLFLVDSTDLKKIDGFAILNAIFAAALTDKPTDVRRYLLSKLTKEQIQTLSEAAKDV